MIWLVVMLVIGIVVGRLSYRYGNDDGPQGPRGGGLFMIAIVCLPLLTGCGGGGDGEEAADEPTRQGSSVGVTAGLMCVAQLLVSGNDACVNAALSSGSGASGNSGGSSSASGSRRPPGAPKDGWVRIRSNYEVEPNNDPINASYVAFGTSGDRDGFTVDGHISDAGDAHDHFRFTRPRTRIIRFVLCPPGETFCDQTMTIDPQTAFLELLDQDANVIASTQSLDSNLLELAIDAGLPYTVRVTAADTMAAVVAYRLTGYEMN